MRHKTYSYTLQEDHIYFYDFTPIVQKGDSLKTEWGIIKYDKIIIHKGYSWNGCSGHVWQGKTIIPLDWMPKISKNSDRYTDTLAGTVLHDYIYQFLLETTRDSKQGLYKVRKFADKLFYKTIKRSKFSLARIYYYGVRVFGMTTYVGKTHNLTKRGMLR